MKNVLAVSICMFLLGYSYVKFNEASAMLEEANEVLDLSSRVHDRIETLVKSKECGV